jgi:hypothetical protein
MLEHDEDGFVNRCDRMPRRTQRGIDETKKDAVSAYRRVCGIEVRCLQPHEVDNRPVRQWHDEVQLPECSFDRVRKTEKPEWDR